MKNNKIKKYKDIITICIFADIIFLLMGLVYTNIKRKPVLYLYPETETNVEVKFSKPELLTTTYWEELSTNKFNFNEGFYVEKDNAIEFLEEKLSILGLNDKERNEFIMYWLPILEQNKKSLVYFETTESLQKENELIINPKPDSLLRIRMHVKKINHKIEIKEQELPNFERKGFAAVEWGGIIY